MSHATDPRIVVFGGGTGSFVVLSALKTITKTITAIVSMSDDGGSTGVLRDELGVLPPGDVRQCLVALSERPEVRDLFSYRFNEGTLAGHSLGNIILSGLELQHGSFEKALEVAANILRIRGRVVPAVLGSHTLVMDDGETAISGQHNIDLHQVLSPQARVRLEPASALNPAAKKAIEQADLVVIAPGSIYTSLLPIFAAEGTAAVLAGSTTPVIMVANLINKPMQTEAWHVVDYVQKVESYIGDGRVTTVLYNTESIPAELLTKYAEEGEFPVATTKKRFDQIQATAVGLPLLSPSFEKQDPADKAIRRTLIRHDQTRLAAAIQSLLTTQTT